MGLTSKTVLGSGGGGGADVQYTQGTTQATPTGTVALGKSATDVLTALVVDGSGNLNVNVAAGGGSGGTASTFGAAFPGTGTAIGAKDSAGTSLAALNLDASGFLKVNVAAGGASGGTSSSFGAAVPGTGTAAGFSDGTNLQLGRVFDADSGAGTQYVQGATLRKTASGGSVEAGTLADPLRVDTTGTTTQPVSAASLPLPTGAATGALQTSGNSSLTSIDGKITACNTGAVVVSSSGLPTGASTSALQTSGNASLTSLDGKVTACNTGAVVVSSSGLPTGAATSALQTTGNSSLSSIDGKITACNTGAVVVSSGTVTANAGTGTFATSDANAQSQGSTSSGQKGYLELGAVTTAAPTYTTAQSSPLSLNTAGGLRVDGSGVTQPVSGTVTANAGTGSFTVAQATGSNLHTVVDSGTVTTVSTVTNISQEGGVAVSLGNGTAGTGSRRVAIASDNTPFTVNTAHAKTIKTVTGTVSATTTIVAAVTSKRIKVIAISLRTASTSAVTATFKDGAGGTALWTEPMQAITGTYMGANVAMNAPSSFFGTTAGNLLELSLSAAQSVTYNVTYFDDDAT